MKGNDKATNKKKAKWITGTIFVIIVFWIISLPGSSKNTDKTEPSPTPNKLAESTDLKTDVQVAEYARDMLPLMLDIQSANKDLTKAATYGSELKFESAGVFIGSAASQYQSVKDDLQDIDVPPQAEEAHKLINEAVDKFQQAVTLYQEGLESYDADLIGKGVEIYKEGVEIMNQASDKLQKLNNS